MKLIFAVDYKDGKHRAKAGDPVPATIPSHRVAMLRRARVIVEAPVVASPITPAKRRKVKA